jgi:hypothetical protein
MLSEELNTGKAACHKILLEDLGNRKLNARLIPHSRTEQQEKYCSAIYATLLKPQGTITHSALPSSLEMKHGACCMTQNKKTKRRVERHELTCLKEILRPAFASKSNVYCFYQLQRCRA